MGLVTPDVARSKLEAAGAEVHNVQATADLRVLIFRASYAGHHGPIQHLPALFVTLCMANGGRVQQLSNRQDLDCDFAPGQIGLMPPYSKGRGIWPEMTTITIGIAVESVADAFGWSWPDRLSRSVVSQVFRDPLVEATMMDIGYVRANNVSDATLLHAAHMIIHQLLDHPFEESNVPSDVHPLGQVAVAKVINLLTENMDRHLTVEEMADVVGMSRHHFSRRFKAATGKSPYQFALCHKLQCAADLLKQEHHFSVTEIAQNFGFDNPGQFTRQFIRLFGIAPRFWRNNAKD